MLRTGRMNSVADETVRKAQNGDREAFTQLIREHHPRVLLLCRSMMSDTASADDAAQEVFLKVFQRLGSFDGRSQFSTWLHRIAANHCLDLLRKKGREKTESIEGIQHSDGGSGVSAVEAEHEVSRLLEGLPQEQRTAIILREMQGYSYEEIAKELGWTLDSVKARLRRARENLAEKMRHFGGPDSVL